MGGSYAKASSAVQSPKARRAFGDKSTALVLPVSCKQCFPPIGSAGKMNLVGDPKRRSSGALQNLADARVPVTNAPAFWSGAVLRRFRRAVDLESSAESEAGVILARFMERLHSLLRMPWDHESLRTPPNRPSGTFSPIGGEKDGW